MTHAFWYHRYIEFESIQYFIDKYGPIKSIHTVLETKNVVLAIVVSTNSITQLEAQTFWNEKGGTDGLYWNKENF